MRQLVQIEGSNVCGPTCAAMILDHLGLPWDAGKLVARAAEIERQAIDLPRGTQFGTVTGLLVEGGCLAFSSQHGLPHVQQADGYWRRTHHPRANRLTTWYTVHALLSAGFIAVTGIYRDQGKLHYVCVDDAFERAQERWFSVWCPIRGHYEENVERFLMDPAGKDGDGHEWIFARKRPDRFASAAELAKLGEAQDEDAAQA